jgi:hypothetical protein
MSTDYCCYAIIGVKIPRHTIETVDKQAVYEINKRYSLLGELIKTEKVLVSPVTYKYRLGYLEFNNFYKLATHTYPNKLKVIYDHNNIYIGLQVKNKQLGGNFSFPIINHSMEKLSELFQMAAINLAEVGINEPICLYTATDIL